MLQEFLTSVKSSNESTNSTSGNKSKQQQQHDEQLESLLAGGGPLNSVQTSRTSGSGSSGTSSHKQQGGPAGLTQLLSTESLQSHLHGGSGKSVQSNQLTELVKGKVPTQRARAGGRFVKTNSTGVTKKINKTQAVNVHTSRADKIIALNSIEELPKQQSQTKRFRVRFTLINKDGRRRNQSIRFGRRSQEEYIDNGSQVTQMQRLSRLITSKYAKDPLKPAHWDVWLLNTKPTLHEATAYYREQHNII